MPNFTITRDDISRFVVHLTKDDSGKTASKNLINILKTKCIEARTPHCLFKHYIENGDFSEDLQQRFYTSCFTEIPLTQIRYLTDEIPGRSVHLKPFGLVFRRTTMLESGASPAIYLNAHGTGHRNLLLRRFRKDFDDIEDYDAAKFTHKEYTDSLISYYALCNVISDRHDFSWEREWRHCGDFQFKYYQVVAILVRDVPAFKKLLERNISGAAARDIQKIPLINPEWNYERVVAQMSRLIKETYKAFNEESV